LAVGGVVLAVLAVRQLMATHTTVDPHGSVTFVVASGPYGISRNPIYLGFVLFLTGFPLALNTFWGLILGPALVLSFNLLVVQYEEAYLERKFGRVYQDYKLRVRRWV
jgi:protein-S-isoprenylcysteine O-methyltransferase Ste14